MPAEQAVPGRPRRINKLPARVWKEPQFLSLLFNDAKHPLKGHIAPTRAAFGRSDVPSKGKQSVTRVSALPLDAEVNFLSFKGSGVFIPLATLSEAPNPSTLGAHLEFLL